MISTCRLVSKANPHGARWTCDVLAYTVERVYLFIGSPSITARLRRKTRILPKKVLFVYAGCSSQDGSSVERRCPWIAGRKKYMGPSHRWGNVANRQISAHGCINDEEQQHNHAERLGRAVVHDSISRLEHSIFSQKSREIERNKSFR